MENGGLFLMTLLMNKMLMLFADNWDMILDVRIRIVMIVGSILIFTFIIDGYTDVRVCCTRFGQGSGPIHMNYLGCSGTEHKLVDCYYQNSTRYHYDDWSVTCTNGKDSYFCGCHAIFNLCYPFYNDFLYHAVYNCIQNVVSTECHGMTCLGSPKFILSVYKYTCNVKRNNMNTG